MTKFIDSFSEDVWRTTYKDINDNTVDDTFRRVSKAISEAEKTEELKREWEEKFFEMLSDFKAIPGGRILSNAGTNWSNTYFNCFVGPRESFDIDSIDGILSHLKSQVLTLKSEGGWGDDFSYIRPRGAFIYGIGVESPGAVKYMELFNKSSDVITSGSGKKSSKKENKIKIRKGAMMGTLACWHPDVLEFIQAKQSEGRLDKFNISVNCTDKFMNKLLKVQELIKSNSSKEEIDKEDVWELIFPDTTHERYKSEWRGFIDEWEQKGYPIIVYNTIKVTYLWDLIMKSTYSRNDPGVLFLDRAQHFYPANYQARIVSSNPCGEQLMPSFGVCDIGSLNLTQFLLEDYSDFDYEKIKKYAKYLTRFLDNVNDLSKAPHEGYKDSMISLRRIGVGIMGWASSLYMMQVKFGSSRAEFIREKMLQTLSRSVYEASIDLAEEKGCFRNCDIDKHYKGEFINSLQLSEQYLEKLKKSGIRNSSCLSIQPTGNTSIFSNIVSGGLEPIFSYEYIRTVIVSATPEHIKNKTPKWQEGEFVETEMFKNHKEGNDVVLRGIDEFGTVFKIDKNRGLTKEVFCTDYSVRNLRERNLWNPKAEYVVSAGEISLNDHLNDFKDFCKYMDSACSKTINLSNDMPFEEFKDIYLNAYETGYIKGLTTYREGTMATVLSKNEKKQDEQVIKFEQRDATKRPKILPCDLHVISVKNEKWLIIIGLLDGKPYEIFGGKFDKIEIPTKIKQGRLIKNGTKLKSSYDLEIDLSDEIFLIKDVVQTFNNTEYALHTRLISLSLRHGANIKYIIEQIQKDENSSIFDFSKIVARCLKKYIGNEKSGLICSECLEKLLIYQEGCLVCSNCGASKCQ